MSYIRKAITEAGGPVAAASSIGISPQAVGKWLKQGFVAPGSALAVHNACRRRVSLYQLLKEVDDAKRGSEGGQE